MHALFPSLLALLANQIEVAYAAETGIIQGVVTDETDLPVPGAEVTLSGVDLAGERVVTTDANGNFRFGDLAPGVYELAVTFKGALVARAEVRVALNTTTNVPIPAKMGSVAEEIEVIGFRPVIDTTTSSFSTQLSADEFQELPVGRSYQDVIQTIPGVSGRIDTSGGGGGDGNPSVRGEGQYGNNYTIDGVSTRDPATKTYGQNVNFDAIEEIQVYTDGAPAEFGQFTGMMVNVVTKDGGDEHHGSAAIFYSQHAFFEKEYPIFDPAQIEEVPTIKARFRAPTFNGTAGGPIIKEKLWYFTALDLNYSWAIPEGVDATDPDTGDSNAITATGGQFMGKVTWFPTPTLTFRYIFNGSYSTSARIDASQFVAPAATTDRVDWSQNHRLTATFTPDDKNILELHGGYLNQNIDVVPTSGDHETPARLDAQGALNDNAYDFDLNDRNRIGGGVSYTRFIDHFLGSHTWKAGAEAWMLVAQREIQNTGETTIEWIDSNGELTGQQTEVGTRFGPYDDPLTPEFDFPCTQPDHSDCGIREHWTNVGPLGNKVYTYQLYLQDDWTPAKQLTINAGVRMDIEDGRADDGSRPPTQDPTLYDPTGLFTGVLPSDADKQGEYGPIFMPAPRLGFSLDPLADGKTKISGHYGQYYDLAGNNLWEWSNSRSSNSFVRFVRDPGTGEFVWSNTQDAAGAPLIYDEALKPPVMNKVNLGVEREVIKDMSVGLRGILSSTTNLPEDVDANYQDWYIMNVPIKRRIYRALELTVHKQFDEVWQVFGSYTLSEAFGNTPGQFELAPGATSGSDGNNVGVYLDDIGDKDTRAFFIENGFGWFLDGFHGLGRYSPKDPEFYDEAGWYGYLPYHSFHMIKLNGSYTAPFGTTFGLVYEFDSGHAWEKRTFVPFYGYDAFGQGRGSRFMPAVHYIDGRVAHQFSWGKDKNQSLEATLDIFNIPGFMQAITYYSVDAPGFGSVLYRQSPRSVRVGLKYRY